MLLRFDRVLLIISTLIFFWPSMKTEALRESGKIPALRVLCIEAFRVPASGSTATEVSGRIINLKLIFESLLVNIELGDVHGRATDSHWKP